MHVRLRHEQRAPLVVGGGLDYNLSVSLLAFSRHLDCSFSRVLGDGCSLAFPDCDCHVPQTH